MNIIQAISFIQYNNGGVVISFKEAAAVCNVTEVTIYKYKKKDIPAEWIERLETEYNCKLPCDEKSSQEIALEFTSIPYWDGCDILAEKLKNPACTRLNKDLEIVVNGYSATPENLRIIAMPSDKMDGGLRPIKYGDVLIIDTSFTDISYSGIYFFTANNDVFINRIEKKIDGVIFKFDNILCGDEFYSFERLENANFKVIGRVIHNEWEKL